MEYNKELVKRFVSDFKLPIAIISEPYFSYFINLYESEFSSLSKYKKLCDIVCNRYNGDANAFLSEYYGIRDNIIKTVENSESYKRFNTLSMSQYKIPNINVSKNAVYNQSNIGKTFLSIDLSSANFQALKWVNKNIVLNTETYGDFIGKFTNLDYIKESKYTRQVIFGKLNPARHITVEKYLTYKVWETYSKNFVDQTKLVSFSNDELVIEINTDICHPSTYEIEKYILETLNLNVHAEYFFLEGIRLVKKSNGHFRDMCFAKHNLYDDRTKLMCVPLPYFAITYKLFHNMVLCEYDYHFNYEGIDCKFNEDFILERINNNII